jgi:hypothetical protein
MNLFQCKCQGHSLSGKASELFQDTIDLLVPDFLLMQRHVKLLKHSSICGLWIYDCVISRDPLSCVQYLW